MCLEQFRTHHYGVGYLTSAPLDYRLDYLYPRDEDIDYYYDGERLLLGGETKE